MGFFSRLGNKIAGGLQHAARVGSKVLGSAARLGNKIAKTGSDIVGGIERIPILGQVLAPATGLARSGLAMVKNLSAGADRGSRMLHDAGDIVRQGREVLRTGDLGQAHEVLRRGHQLHGEAKSSLERAKSEIKAVRKK